MNFKKYIQDFIIINIGLFICSLGIVNFLIPSKLAAGGVTGMSTLLYYILEFPVGVTMLALNVPIFILGFFVYGKEYAVKCLCGIFLLPAYTGLSESLFSVDLLADFSGANPLAGAIFAGLVVGLGIGIAVAVGSNTGGTVILAQVVSKYLKIPVGSCMAIVDSMVVISSMFVFGIKSAAMALVCIFIMGRMVNLVMGKITHILESRNKTAFA